MRQNQFLKVVRNCEKLSNEATKLNFKSRPKLIKTVQRSYKLNSQKLSENAKNCLLNCRGNIAINVEGLWSGGGFETRPPERPSI